MVLGRSTSGAIKIKTDDGLRAVECACCGCQGMFKVAGVDFPMPVSTATLTQIGDGGSYPTVSQISGYGQYTNLNTEPSAFGALGIIFVASFQAAKPLDTLDFFYGEICGTGNAVFNARHTEVQISLPTQIYASGFWGPWECPNGGVVEGGPNLTGYIPVQFPTPPTCETDEGPAEQAIWYRDNSYGVFTGQNYQLTIGSAGLWNANIENSVIYVQNMEIYDPGPVDVGIAGVTLKNLETQETFSAVSTKIGDSNFYEIAQIFGFRPYDGTSLDMKFAGFNRTTQGNYELTWPLLKSPYRFTIPA